MPHHEQLIPPYEKRTLEPCNEFKRSLKLIESADNVALEQALQEWVEDLVKFEKSIELGGYDDERLELSIKLQFHKAALQALLAITTAVLKTSDEKTQAALSKQFNQELNRYVAKAVSAFRNQPRVADVDPVVADQAYLEDESFR